MKLFSQSRAAAHASRCITLCIASGALLVSSLSTGFASSTRQDSTTPPQTDGLPAQTTPPKTTPAKPKGITVLVDGEEIKFGANGPRSINGRTMVPFRPLFEALGASVEYDLVHKVVTADKEDIKIELTIGDKIAKRNGAEITMANAPVLFKGTTFVPLRFVAESLEANVDFDSKAQLITITLGDQSQ